MNANEAIKGSLEDRLPQIRRIVQRIARNDGVVDDIVQECCVQIIEKEHLCRNEGKMTQWVNAVVRNLTLRQVGRKRWERERTVPLEEEKVISLPEVKEFSEEHIGWMLQQFKSLADMQKQVVQLYYFKEMNTVEISKELGISKQAVSGHLSRALSTLKKRAKAQGLLGLLLPWNWDFSRWAKVGLMAVEQKVVVGGFAVLLFVGGYVVSEGFLGTDEPGKRVAGITPIKPSNSSLPEVKPVEVPKPKNTFEEMQPSKKPNTAWDKDGDGKVDAGFTGVRREWWDVSKTKLKVETPYKEGKKHGVKKMFFITGELEIEKDFQEGLSMNGSKRHFNKSGQLMAENPYENGNSSGFIKHYYESGNLKLKMPNVGVPLELNTNGIAFKLAQGPEAHYAKDGALTKQIQHDGKGGSKIIYDPSSNIDLR